MMMAMLSVSDHAEHILLVIMGGGGAWFVSAATSTMPPLPPDANYFLKWLWALLHVIGANLDKVHIPGSPADIAAGPPAGPKQ